MSANQWVAIDTRGRTAAMSNDDRRLVDAGDGFVFDAGTEERAERIAKSANAYPRLVEALRYYINAPQMAEANARCLLRELEELA